MAISSSEPPDDSNRFSYESRRSDGRKSIIIVQGPIALLTCGAVVGAVATLYLAYMFHP
jgi:hypothetical protein